MKKIISILITTFVFINVSTLSAKAEDSTASNIKSDGTILYCQGNVCSTTPPAPATVAGFAVVNSEGEVKGAIACNIASCPSTLEGTYMGCTNCTLVQQTPATENNNATGIISTLDRPVTYNSQTQLFTQVTDAPVSKSETIDNNTTINATVYSGAVTFTPNNVVNGEMQFTPVATSSTSATISVTEGLTKEMAMFETPKTRAQLQAAIANKLLIIQKYLHRYYALLDGWIID